jgi:amidase
MQMPAGQTFKIIEATIDEVHAAFQRGELTARELVELYLMRIEVMTRRARLSIR